jgi:hypothetical protein
MIEDIKDTIEDWVVDKLKLSSAEVYYTFIETEY